MATLPGNIPYVINLCNSIIGVAVLALPFCFKECGIVLSIVLVLSSGWLTQKTCHMLLKTAFITKKRSYEFLALHVFGRYGKLLVEICIIGMLIGNCIAFYIIIGDLGPAIIAKLTNLENSALLRSLIMSLLAIFIALPLGLLNSLERLSRYSAISLLFYGVFVVQVLIAAIPNIWSGVWYSKVVFWNPEGMFKCLPIFAMAFSCHGQLFIIYDSIPEASITRMRGIVQQGITLCATVYIIVGCFGYITFCDEDISGDILMNFRPTLFSDIVKLGFVMSTVISFPLLIYPCRASIYTLLFTKPEKALHDSFGALYIPALHFKLITVFIVGVTLMIGILVPSVEYVLALTGSTMGSLICFILPASMIITVATVQKGEGRLMAQIILFLGVSILLVSSFVTMTSYGGGENMPVAQESIVKLGNPIVHKDDDMAVAADLEKIIDAAPLGSEEKNILDNLKLDNIENVKTPVKENLSIGAEGKAVGIQADTKDKEIRKEPPNPREPVDQPHVADPLQNPQPQISNKSQQPVPNVDMKLSGLEKVKDNIDKREVKSVESQVKAKKGEGIVAQEPQHTGGSNLEIKAKEGLVEQSLLEKGNAVKQGDKVKHVNLYNAHIDSADRVPGPVPNSDSDIKPAPVSNIEGGVKMRAPVSKIESEVKLPSPVPVADLPYNIVRSKLVTTDVKEHNVQKLESHDVIRAGDTGGVRRTAAASPDDKYPVDKIDESLLKGDKKKEAVVREVKPKLVDPLKQPAEGSEEMKAPRQASDGTNVDGGDGGKEEKEGIDADARDLLVELKKQQEVQKQLIDEQRQILDDLKQHQQQVHKNIDASPSPGKNNEEDKHVKDQDVPQSPEKKSGRLKADSEKVKQTKVDRDSEVDKSKNAEIPAIPVDSNLQGS